MEQTPSPDAANDSSTPGPALLAERQARKAAEKEAAETRGEAAKYRVQLRHCKEQLPAPRVLDWRPADEPGTPLIGLANVQVGDLSIFGLRLFRHHGGHVLSWPMRRPRATGQLVEIMRCSPSLDGQILAAILIHAYPERVAE